MSSRHKKAGVYHAERVIAIGTGEAEGSVMVLATRFNKRVVVTITPEFMAKLSRYIGDYVADVLGATPPPVVEAKYADEPSADPAAELDKVLPEGLDADPRVAAE